MCRERGEVKVKVIVSSGEEWTYTYYGVEAMPTLSADGKYMSLQYQDSYDLLTKAYRQIPPECHAVAHKTHTYPCYGRVLWNMSHVVKVTYKDEQGDPVTVKVLFEKRNHAK